MAILTTLNLSEGSWVSVGSATSPGFIYRIGFTGDTLPVDIENLTVSFTATMGDRVLSQSSHPKNGGILKSTDQEWSFFETINARCDDVIKISLVVSQNGTEYVYDHDLIVPRPEKPFASWEWDAEIDYWQAPTAYPGNDTSFYNWDEETTSWILDSNA